MQKQSLQILTAAAPWLSTRLGLVAQSFSAHLIQLPCSPSYIKPIDTKSVMLERECYTNLVALAYEFIDLVEICERKNLASSALPKTIKFDTA